MKKVRPKVSARARQGLNEYESKPTNYLAGPKAARPTREELLGVPPKAKMIVEGYLPQTVSSDVAPGGSGKSTLQLYEAAHVILARPLYGRLIERPGGVLIISAEDDREITLARMNQVCNALDLNKAEQQKVLRHFYIEDVSATDAKLVVADKNGIYKTRFFDEIVDKYKHAGLAIVVLDPTSHLGPGEISGNDGMAAYMRAAIALSRALGAATRVVHHVSQVVARGGIKDMYAGRGGTAFSDNGRGSRQIIVWRSRKDEHEGSAYELPEEISDRDIAEGNVLGIFVHKISWVKRDSRPIIVVRNGFAFRHVPMDRVDNSDAAKLQRADDEMWRVVDFIRGQLAIGKKISKSDLDDHASAIGLTRKDLRAARDRALQLFALHELKLPKHEQVTKRKAYLSPEKEPNPANPAESRREAGGGITNTGTSEAANLAADGTSIRRRDSKQQKSPLPAGTKEAVSDPIRLNPAARRRLNGKAAEHA